MHNLADDFRHALRNLGRSPGFTAVCIGTIGLGVGLATAVFTVANSVVLRRLPVLDQNRIVVLQGNAADRGLNNVPLDLQHAEQFTRESRTIERGAWFSYTGAGPITVKDGNRVSRMQHTLISGDFFAVLGARPLLGRVLRADDDRAGAAPAMVLSYRAWRQRFGGDSAVIGRQLSIVEYGASYAIVGVMPPGLDYPRGTDDWVCARAAIIPSAWQFLSFDIIGRLAPRAGLADASSELTAFFREHYTTAWLKRVQGSARPLPELVLGDTRPAVIAFAAAAALLLLIACINVANLLLVRGIARQREVAVRTALGASRWRIAAHLLEEHALLAAGGGILGVLLAWGAIHLFVAFAPASLARLDEVHMDPAALAAAIVITTLATLLFALAPAILMSRVDGQEALRSGTRQTQSRRSRQLGDALVSGQIALAVVVLAAAALVGRSLLKLEHVDLAFQPSHLSVAELSFRAEPGNSVNKANLQLQELVSAVGSIPGVEGVSSVVSVPYATNRSWEGRPSAEGQTPEEIARDPMVDIEVVSPSFFTILGLPIEHGRPFTDADAPGAPRVVILSESIARRFWPGRNPIGKREGSSGDLATVIGVVPDTRYRDLRETHSTIYYPLRQSTFAFPPTTLVIRSRRTPADFAAELRAVAAQATPQIEIASAVPFEQLIAEPLAEPRMNALLLGGFASAAILLASVGLFGVLASMVRLRRRELGVRMALGATSVDVAQLIISRGVLLGAIGVVGGTLGALVTNRLLRALLFEVSPTDAITLVVVGALMVFVALVASVIPARASARVAPSIALQAE